MTYSAKIEWQAFPKSSFEPGIAEQLKIELGWKENKKPDCVERDKKPLSPVPEILLVGSGSQCVPSSKTRKQRKIEA